MRTAMRRTAKRALRAVGLDVRPVRAARRRDDLGDVLAHAVSLGFAPAAVLDVGVGHGTPPLYQAFPSAAHVLVEPLQEFRRSIEEIVRRFGATWVEAAAGPRTGTTAINVHPFLPGSSVLTEKGHHPDISTRSVPMIALDDLPAEMDLRPPYLVKLDVQGAELLALDGAARVLSETEMVILEASLFRFVEGGPDLFDVVVYMKERSFVVYEVFSGHNRKLDGALGQIDLAFVKEEGAVPPEPSV